MDLEDGLISEIRTKHSTCGNALQQNSSLNTQPFTPFNPQLQQKWEDPSLLDHTMRIDPSFSKNSQTSENSSLLMGNPNNRTKITNQKDSQINQILDNGRIQDWDPRAMLSNLSFLEQKIHQLQELVHMIVGQRGNIPGNQDELVTQQQQLITANLTSIIVQLISTAGALLPSVKQSLAPANPSDVQLNGVLFPPPTSAGGQQVRQNVADIKSFEPSNQVDLVNIEEEHELKDEDDGKEDEHLPPGSYEILQLEKEEILAPHTHFCTICGKGFKRDANLRMHMRGHGDEYKTPAALAKPNKESSSEHVTLKRYSCPFVGCTRNKDHKKFQPLKTILCVKNHYKRTHCDKSYTCSRCHTKKFSVIADLKTHEKHCGRHRWLCSCGTTFSRKDKLFGHIALFQGHTPAIPLDDNKGTSGPSNPAENCEAPTKVGNVGLGFGSTVGNENGGQTLMDLRGNVEDPYFSLLNYECGLTGLQEFPQPTFDDSSNSFAFLVSEETNRMQSDATDMD